MYSYIYTVYIYIHYIDNNVIILMMMMICDDNNIINNHIQGKRRENDE